MCFSAGGLLLHPVCADTVECMEQYIYVLCILVYHWICAMSKVGTIFSMTRRSGRVLFQNFDMNKVFARQSAGLNTTCTVIASPLVRFASASKKQICLHDSAASAECHVITLAQQLCWPIAYRFSTGPTESALTQRCY